MKLNLNSNSAKLYRWFYGKEYMPSNLCPYFWKLVIAYIFGLPLLVLTLPYIILNLINGDDDLDTIGSRIFASTFMYAAAYLVVAMLSPIMLLFMKFPKQGTSYLHDLIIQGLTTWVVAIVVGIYFLLRGIHNKYSEKKYEKKFEEKPNIVIEMVKAKYNKYCPKIDWE